MQTLVTVIHVITCFLLVLVILVQSGKGAEISTSLAGSSQTVFGSSGGANVFSRFTSIAAGVFMVTSLTLTLMSGESKQSLFEGAVPATQNAVPAAAVPTPGASPSAPVGPSGPTGVEQK